MKLLSGGVNTLLLCYAITGIDFSFFVITLLRNYHSGDFTFWWSYYAITGIDTRQTGDGWWVDKAIKNSQGFCQCAHRADRMAGMSSVKCDTLSTLFGFGSFDVESEILPAIGR